MEKNQAVFQLDRVCFSYPYEEQVLKDISFEVAQGEKICILGANGSGKSTLLKLLAGLIFPTKGLFRAFGEEISEKSMDDRGFSRVYHKRLGFIFQNSEVQLFCSTVLEEVAFGPLQLNMPAAEARDRAEDMLRLLDIGHLRNKTPFKLSGGEKKKVALACTLVLNPEVLILDEPTNGLDPRTQRWLVEFLINLNTAGKTIITSTHNLELIQEISNRSIIFGEDHMIAADGITSELLSDVELLKKVNLVDEYYHRHGSETHQHFHIHNYKI